MLPTLFLALTLAAPTPCVEYAFVRTEDPARTFGTPPAARPIEYGLWYPAERCASAKPLTQRDYARDAAIQAGVVQTSDAELVARLETGVTEASVLDTPAVARRGTSPDDTPRPLVVYIHANALEAAPLAEALAAAGNTVAALTWRGTREQAFDVGVSGFMTEIEDAQFVAADVARRGTRITARHAIGTSFGAMTALCWAAKDRRVSRVASLDGGIVSPFGPKLMGRCPYFDAKSTELALLNAYDGTYAELTLEWVRSLAKTTTTDFPVPALSHADYHGTVLLRTAAAAPEDRRASEYRALVARVVDFLRE